MYIYKNKLNKLLLNDYIIISQKRIQFLTFSRYSFSKISERNICATAILSTNSRLFTFSTSLKASSSQARKAKIDLRVGLGIMLMELETMSFHSLEVSALNPDIATDTIFNWLASALSP